LGLSDIESFLILQLDAARVYEFPRREQADWPERGRCNAATSAKESASKRLIVAGPHLTTTLVEERFRVARFVIDIHDFQA